MNSCRNWWIQITWILVKAVAIWTFLSLSKNLTTNILCHIWQPNLLVLTNIIMISEVGSTQVLENLTLLPFTSSTSNSCGILLHFCVKWRHFVDWDRVGAFERPLVWNIAKAQRTRALSSSFESNFLRSYHKFRNKYWSHFIFRISTKHQLKISTKNQNLHST